MQTKKLFKWYFVWVLVKYIKFTEFTPIFMTLLWITVARFTSKCILIRTKTKKLHANLAANFKWEKVCYSNNCDSFLLWIRGHILTMWLQVEPKMTENLNIHILTFDAAWEQREQIPNFSEKKPLNTVFILMRRHGLSPKQRLPLLLFVSTNSHTICNTNLTQSWSSYLRSQYSYMNTAKQVTHVCFKWVKTHVFHRLNGECVSMRNNGTKHLNQNFFKWHLVWRKTHNKGKSRRLFKIPIYFSALNESLLRDCNQLSQMFKLWILLWNRGEAKTSTFINTHFIDQKAEW